MTTACRADVVADPVEPRIVLHGDVTGAADPALPDAYAAAIEGHPTSVLLDFADVGYMNSTGIALVVELLSAAMRDGVTLKASGLSAHYREIFEITRLSEHIVVVDAPVTASATGGSA